MGERYEDPSDGEGERNQKSSEAEVDKNQLGSIGQIKHITNFVNIFGVYDG